MMIRNHRIISKIRTNSGKLIPSVELILMQIAMLNGRHPTQMFLSAYDLFYSSLMGVLSIRQQLSDRKENIQRRESSNL